MKPLSLKATVALIAALGSALAPFIVSAQVTHEYKKPVPSLTVRAPASPPVVPDEPTSPGDEAPAATPVALSLSSSSVSFGSQDLNKVARASLLVSNTGASSASISGLPSVSGSSAFAATTSCGSSLPAGADCAIEFQFTPTTTEAVSGSMTWAYAAGLPSLYATLTGSGRAAIDITSVSPTQVSSLVAPTLTIMGSGFSDGITPKVYVGDRQIDPSDVTVVNDTTLTVLVPAQGAGTYAITVTSSKGSTKTLSDALKVVAPLGGTVTTVHNTLPGSFGNCSSMQGAVGYGTQSFLLQCMTSNYGGNLYKAVWNGTAHTYSTVYNYGTMSTNGIGGVAVDPRGYILAGQGNYNMSNSFRLSVLSGTATSQSAPLNFYSYTGITGANYAVSAIARDPQVANGYVAVLRSTAAGAKTILKFTVTDAGAIANVQALGNRPTGAPTLPPLGSAVVGNDGMIYVGTSRFGNGTAQPIVKIDPSTGDISLAYGATQGTFTLAMGFASDSQGNLYMGTTTNVVLRAAWTGSGYGTPQIIAGRESLPGHVDGPLGTNRIVANTVVVSSPGNTVVGLIGPGIGGANSTYRVIQ